LHIDYKGSEYLKSKIWLLDSIGKMLQKKTYSLVKSRFKVKISWTKVAGCIGFKPWLLKVFCRHQWKIFSGTGNEHWIEYHESRSLWNTYTV